MSYKAIKCPICGNTESSEFKINNNKIVCGYCDAMFFTMDSEMQSRLNNALDHRTLYKFDDADYLYSKIADEAEDNDDYNTYCIAEWGRLLCEFGVVYVKGFGYNASTVPTFSNFNHNYDSVTKSEFYSNIMNSNAPEGLKDYYKKQANKLDETYAKIGKELNDKPEYDVFICTKITTKTDKEPNNDGYTSDSKIAEKLYYELTNNYGLKVFYSDKCCKGVSYDSQIFSALLKSKNIIVISSKLEYLESCWVQSEWRRWINFIKWGDKAKDSIYLYLPYFNIKAFTLPKIFNKNKIQYYTLDKESEMLNLIIKQRLLDKEPLTEHFTFKNNENKIQKDNITKQEGKTTLNKKQIELIEGKDENEEKDIVQSKIEENVEEEIVVEEQVNYNNKYKEEQKDVKTEINLLYSNLKIIRREITKKSNLYIPIDHFLRSKNKDVNKLINSIKEISDKDDIEAIYILGVIYEYSNLDDGKHQSIKCYISSAENGYALAQNKLGDLYTKGDFLPMSFEEAAKWYKKAADQGNANAQYNLGICYAEGEGVSKNPKEAVNWYRKAADQGSANAQYNLGICYAEGEGVSKNPKEAVKWYRKAADQGHVNAQYDLGCCYEKGYGVAMYLEEAVKWYRKAADQGHVNAQYDLGRCYEKGYGVAMYPEEAVKWYRKAADQGHVNAQYDLGCCYEKGYGVDRSINKALDLYLKVAEILPELAYECGKKFQNGDGVNKDLITAARFYSLARENGYHLSIKEKWISFIYKKRHDK